MGAKWIASHGSHALRVERVEEEAAEDAEEGQAHEEPLHRGQVVRVRRLCVGVFVFVGDDWVSCRGGADSVHGLQTTRTLYTAAATRGKRASPPFWMAVVSP